MGESRYHKEVAVTLELARRAAAATERIRENGIRSARKDDRTPVTQADLVSQAVILSGLHKHFPNDKIQAEETISPGGKNALCVSAGEILRDLGYNDESRNLERVVNYRGDPNGRRIWMIDPIDGTKGFERGLSYAIAIGLYFDGRPVFGCMAAPAFPGGGESGERTIIAYAGEGEGAYRLEDGRNGVKPLRVSDVQAMSRMRLVGSRAHDMDDICGRFVGRAGIQQLIRIDGQAKYLMLALARADVYIRSADPHFGIAYPWDHCTGQIILEEAGGRVTDFDGNPIDYEPSPGQPITDLDGLVASNGRCHEQVLDMLRDIA